MAYSHVRLRKALATARILTGALVLSGGLYKLFSPEFASIEFPHKVLSYVNGQAVSFYSLGALEFVWRHASRFATAMGLIEVALGAALVLGLAIRPAAVLAAVYVLNFVLVTWHQSDGFASDLEGQSGRLLLLLLLALFAVGHAGETWGAGSLYHASRARLFRSEPSPPPVPDDDEFAAEEAGIKDLP